MLNEILSEYEKVREKDKNTKKCVIEMMKNLKEELKKLDSELEANSDNMTDSNINDLTNFSLTKTVNKVNEMDTLKNYNSLCNNFYGGLTKLGKIMSKNLEGENLEDYKLYEYDKNLFNKIIVKDLYRRGDFETADSLIKESKIPFNQNFRFIFNDLNYITRDLKEKNIESLLEWCEKNKTLLKNMNSTLDFESLKLKFILNIKSKSAFECVEYSKRYFQEYIKEEQYFDQITKIMTLLIFKDNMHNCPYIIFDEETLWNKVTHIFVTDCCTILNLPNESGFYFSTLAGMISLPQILKAEKILKLKKEIINEKELPYEIHLPNELKFHPLFVCPVTKEISTPENPPMLLNCGHAVSQNALEKMQKGTSMNRDQIKCPTCPNIQSIKDAIKLQIF